MGDSESERARAAAEALAAQDLSKLPLPSRAEQARLLAMLPEVDPDAPIMVSCPLSLPMEVEREVTARAAAEGVTASEWIRDAIEQVLTAEGGSGRSTGIGQAASD